MTTHGKGLQKLRAIVVVLLAGTISSSASLMAFPQSHANAIAVPESIQESFPPGGNETSTQVNEQLSPVQEAIVDHMEMARLALRGGNLTMAIEQIIFALELSTGTSSDIGLSTQNETESSTQLQPSTQPEAPINRTSMDNSPTIYLTGMQGMLSGTGNGTAANANTSAAATNGALQIKSLNEEDVKEIVDNAAEAYLAIKFNATSPEAALYNLENIITIATGANNVSKILAEANFPVTDDIQNSTETATMNQTSANVIPSDSPKAEITPIQQETQNNNTRTFRIIFEELHINVDHDPLFEGEWLMDVYVNEHRVPLFPGSISVDNGETIDLTGFNNDLTVTVPDNGGHIWIVTAGWENDVGFEALPDLAPQFGVETEENLAGGIVEEEDLEALDAGEAGVGNAEYIEEFEDSLGDEIQGAIGQNMTFDEYVRAIQETVAEFTVAPANDPQGFVKKAFTSVEGYGVGQHQDCSEPNTIAVAGDPNTLLSQDCDFELKYRIEEVR